MGEMDQYYRTLELKPGASEEEIKQAHEDLVNIWDPSRVSSDPRLQGKASEKLKEINLAYEKLMAFMAGSPEESWSPAGEPSPSPQGTLTGMPSAQAPDGMVKRKGIKKAYAFGAVALIVLAGAAISYFLYFGNPSHQALAHVNGEKISLEQFNKELSQVENPMREMYKEDPEQFLNMIVVKLLLLQEAKKQGLSVPPKTYKDASKESLPPEEALISELMKKKFSSPVAVSREEIEAFYSMFKDRMGGKPLNEVAPAIEQLIQQGKQQEELSRFVKELQDKAKIEIDQNRLKKIAANPPESNTGEDFKKAIADGKPALVDFGSNSCVPCRQMRPLLKEIGSEYADKAKVLVIDISKNEELAREYKIQLIPTLVFFDAKGKEVFRHVGAWDKENIVAKLKEIGT